MSSSRRQNLNTSVLKYGTAVKGQLRRDDARVSRARVHFGFYPMSETRYCDVSNTQKHATILVLLCHITSTTNME